MAYYTVKVDFATGETNPRTGVDIVTKGIFLVPGEHVLEVESKLAEYLRDSVSSYETTQITKTKIEAVLD